MGKPIAPYPHCDNLVIHRNCHVCDLYPELQQERIKNGINFTGENDPNKLPCPAEQRRSLRDINRWQGNRLDPVDPVERVVIYKGTKDAQ